MTHDEYCINICKAKCCRLFEEPNGDEKDRCRKLGTDFKCTIHHLWENNTCNQTKETIGFETRPILRVIQDRLLPQWVEDRCCYAHPELLENDR